MKFGDLEFVPLVQQIGIIDMNERVLIFGVERTAVEAGGFVGAAQPSQQDGGVIQHIGTTGIGIRRGAQQLNGVPPVAVGSRDLASQITAVRLTERCWL